VTRIRWAWVVAAIAALAVAATTWLLVTRHGPADERPDVALDRLLLSVPASGVAGDPALWTVERTWSYLDPGAPNLVRRWSANGRAPELTQTVYRHRNAAAAEDAWDSDDPAARIAKQFSGTPSAVPIGLRLSASRATLSCAASDRHGCKIWVYWARYGQYDVALEYTSIDTAVPRSRFEAHVQALDQHLADSF
jgi:hypothetical protein